VRAGWLTPATRSSFTTVGVTLTERVFGVVVDAEAEPILSREHTEYRWAELSGAVRLLHYASNKASVRCVHDLVAGEVQGSQAPTACCSRVMPRHRSP
jgi:hypothetical protein